MPGSHRRALVLAAALLALLAWPSPAAPGARAQTPEPRCSSQLDKTAAPGTVKKGEDVTVTLHIDGTCPPRELKADVVLVVDRSRSMLERTGAGATTKLEAAQAAATSFVDALDPALVQVGLVVFDDVVEELVYLTTDKAKLRTAIASIVTDTGTNLVDSLDAGYRMATSAGARPDAQPVIVFMTDGQHNFGTGVTPPLANIFPIIAKVHAAGILVHSIGLGAAGDIDAAILRQIAGDPSRFHHSLDGSDLEQIFQDIAGVIRAAVLYKTLVVRDVVPANMTYVVDSAQPPAAWDAAARTLSWTFTAVPESGQTMTYLVRPQEAGTHPTNVEASAEFRDGLDQDGRLPFPVPKVTVKVDEVPGICVCRITRQKVPPAMIDLALSNPPAVMGWNQLQDPNAPGAPIFPTPGHDWPPNPRRTCLDLLNRSIHYHPLFNSVIWRAGCLEGPSGP